MTPTATTTASVRRFARATFAGSVAVVAVPLLIVAIARLVALYPSDPADLVVADYPSLADAVVVLHGAGYRMAHAVDLVRLGYADTIIHPGYDAWAAAFLMDISERTGVAFRLLLPDHPDTTSTYAEAVNTRRVVARTPEITRILIVTSGYHSLRTQWVFRLLLPRHVQIAMVPAPQEYWTPARARADTRRASTFRTERRKLVGYFFVYGWQRPIWRWL